MQIIKHRRAILNLSLRSFFHLFVSGSLFYFARSHFNITIYFGVIGAFLTATTNEVIEAVTRVENSFHTREVFKRDRLLATLAFIYTTVIVRLHLLFATLLAPISLLLLTSYIDQKKIKIKAEKRNFIKPVADIMSITLGPIACIVLLELVKLK